MTSDWRNNEPSVYNLIADARATNQQVFGPEKTSQSLDRLGRKLAEEVFELSQAIAFGPTQYQTDVLHRFVRSEIGDVLFVVLSIAALDRDFNPVRAFEEARAKCEKKYGGEANAHGNNS